MKYFSKQIIAFFILLVCMGVSARDGVVRNAMIPGAKEGAVQNNGRFTPQQCAFIKQLVQDAEEIFLFFGERIARFVDIADTTPYRTYVAELSDRLDRFESKMMQSLKTELAYTDKASVYYQGVSIVQEVLSEFLGKLHDMRQVLVKYVSVKDNPSEAFKLANELKPHIEGLIAAGTWNKLSTALQKVQRILQQVGEPELHQKVAAVALLLKKTQKDCSGVAVSPTTMVTCLRKKFRYNK